ncbi:MAG: hypothetical protein HQ445_08695 [Polaromonas sp.]|nr:hypothetical protein [Polaromonas sp.]
MQNKSYFGYLFAALFLLLSACAANSPPTPVKALAKPELTFVDLQSFDRELTAALSEPLPMVEVAFFDRITPSALPDRLQHWMVSVEAGGGSVKVLPPKSSLTPRDPFLIISLLTSLWSASDMFKSLSNQAQYKSARGFDAEIILKMDDKGDAVVDRVVFLKKPKG